MMGLERHWGFKLHKAPEVMLSGFVSLCFSHLFFCAIQFSSVQFSCSVVFNSVTPWTAARQASLSITNSWILLRLTSVESVMPSNHFILCHPLLLLLSIFPSITVFSNESFHVKWPKYWSFSFSISPFIEYSGLIYFKMDWLNLLGVQGTLKSLSRVQKDQFFCTQPSL